MTSIVPPRYRLFTGIDVAAKTFTATWTADRAQYAPSVTLAQTSAGIAQFQQHLQATGIAPAETLVVLEATGSYWMALAVALHTAGFAVSVVNPTQTHNWAKSLSRRGKTDPIDARMLTQFAAERQPATWTPPPTIYHELRQRLTARDALLAVRQQMRNQRHALAQWPVSVPAVIAQLDAVIADMEERIAQLDAEITHVLHDGAWATSAGLLESVPGIGVLTAAWLLVLTVNFSLCATPEAVTNYAGLAPLPRDSGTSVHGRAQLGHGGNARLRTVVYLATLSAAQHNPVIKAFYERLRAVGKPMKVARCAAARKLLHLAYAVVTQRRRFDPAYQQRAGIAGS